MLAAVLLGLLAALGAPSSTSDVGRVTPQVVTPQPRPSTSPKPEPRSDAATALVHRPRKDPFANLFEARPIMSPDWASHALDLTQPSVANPSIVCGMTVWRVDPKVDSKMNKPVPQQGVEFTLRLIEPPVCRGRP